MTVYIGVDLHARQQTLAYVDTQDGEIKRRELHHQRDDVLAFYQQFTGEVIVGVEASGYTCWFEELLEQLGHRLLVGDAAEIRRLARRRQKNDRRDAELILDLLTCDEFPTLYRYSQQSREVLRQLRFRHKLVRMRTMIFNSLSRALDWGRVEFTGQVSDRTGTPTTLAVATIAGTRSSTR
jgi:transposase